MEEPKWYNKCEHLRLDENAQETNNPFKSLVDIYRGTQLTLDCYHELQHKFNITILGQDLASDIGYFWSFTFIHASVILLIAFVWTFGRKFLVQNVYLPMALRWQVLDKNIDKFTESMWKFTAYTIMWSVAFYVTFCRGYDYFENPLHIWDDWNASYGPIDLCMVYAIETGFYVHSIYAAFYMDVIRKDFAVMVTHHIVTLCLISVSWLVGHLKIGVLIFCLDDISDILLESGKAATYLRHRKDGSFSKVFNFLSDITGVAFAIQW